MLLVNIDVDDLEKGVKFYSEAFGLKVGRRAESAWVEMLPSAGLGTGPSTGVLTRRFISWRKRRERSRQVRLRSGVTISAIGLRFTLILSWKK